MDCGTKGGSAHDSNESASAHVRKKQKKNAKNQCSKRIEDAETTLRPNVLESIPVTTRKGSMARSSEAQAENLANSGTSVIRASSIGEAQLGKDTRHSDNANKAAALKAQTTVRPEVLEPIPPNARRVSSKDNVEKRKRGRGPTKDDKIIPQDGLRWKVIWDKYGCAIGNAGNKLRLRIAMIAKQGELWPIDINWRLQDWGSYESTWDTIMHHFDLQDHENSWDFIFDLLHDRWRDWKSDLKKKWYVPFANDEEALKNCDVRVDPIQWKKMVEYWGTPKAQKIAKQNIANRLCKPLDHHSGSKAFANVNYEMELEAAEANDENDESEVQEVTPLDLYDKVYGPRVENPSASMLKKIDPLITIHEIVEKEMSQTSEANPKNRVEVEYGAMSKVLGPGKSDWVRGRGVGAMRPNTILGRGRNKKNIFLEHQNNSMKENYEKIAEELAALKEERRVEREERTIEKEERRIEREEHRQMMQMFAGLSKQAGFAQVLNIPSMFNHQASSGSTSRPANLG